MKKIFVTILIFGNMALAQENSKNSIPIVHEGELVISKACGVDINKRFVDIYNEYKSQIIDRLAVRDMAFPKDESEKNSLDCYGVLLVSGSTHDRSELPFEVRTSNVKLNKIKCVDEKPFESSIAKVVGQHRETCFYSFPLNLLTENSQLFVDWAANRTGQILDHFPLENPPPGINLNCKPKNKPNLNAFKKILKREYCLAI